MVVPPQGRTTVLQELCCEHPGIAQMKLLAHGIVRWPKIDEEIQLMDRSCLSYQSQIVNPATSPLIPW